MRRFLRSQLVHRPHRPLALGCGILVASIGFVLLTAAAKTSELHVRGSVKSNFRTAYDILVRPSGSATSLERAQRLVRSNYLSGIFGGITFEQYRKIKAIRGVDVAAPIANVGYLMPFGDIPVSVDRFLNADPVQIYRLRFRWSADGQLSHYKGGVAYVYYTRRNRFVRGSGFTPGGEIVPGQQKPLQVCLGYPRSAPQATGPYNPLLHTSLDCFSSRSPEAATETQATTHGLPLGHVGSAYMATFPVLLAAIDPVAEAKLLGLNRTIVSGRYLNPTDAPHIRSVGSGGHRLVPVIASSRTYVDQQLQVSVERLHGFEAQQVPERLASTAAYRFLDALPGSNVGSRQFSIGPVYNKLLGGQYGQAPGEVHSFAYWSVTPAHYDHAPAGALTPQVTTNSQEIWTAPQYFPSGGYFPAPPANQDTQFRQLKEHPASNFFDAQNVLRNASVQIVGRYDPSKLPGFSPLARVPLETYYPPVLEPADARTNNLLHGSALLPSENLGGYIQQPPLLLTTLAGIAPFLNSNFYAGASPAAPISSIRIRVNGVSGPDDLSQTRIRTVATAIHDTTGLDVDITAGSSPHPVQVNLPAGKFGRPALALNEGWSKKGVSILFLRGVDQKRIALFGLILLICAFFAANSALASVRSRRTEIGTLLTLGWSRSAIFRVIIGEVFVVGALAGLLGVVLALAAVEVFSLDASPLASLGVLPVAVLLSVLSALPPAWIAANGAPLDAVRDHISGRVGSGRVKHLSQLALVNLRRVPGRTYVVTLGLAVGVAAFAILLAIDRSFHGTLVGTLLGNAISIEIRSFDYLSVGLTISLAALSVTDVLFLNIRERAPELATLRTLGWSDLRLAQLIGTEALALGAAGGALGGLLGLTVAVGLLATSWPAALIGAVAAFGGALVVTLLASVPPVIRVIRLDPSPVLAAE
jgi:putative ABC transport system permease protein